MQNASPKKQPTDLNANSDSPTTKALRSFPLPPCWQDNERMAVLLAPFRPRAVNPENYDSKMKFWQDLITQYCEHKGAGIFSKRELQLSFARGQRIPYGLDTVLESLRQAKRIRTRAEYEYDPADTWTGWAVSGLVHRPVAWGLWKVRSAVGLGGDADAQAGLLEWVHVEVMKKFCKELQSQVLQQQQGKLLHYEALKELVASTALQLTEDCLQLCLHTLHCQRKIGLEYKQEAKGERQIHLIKVPSKSDASAAITEADRAVHNLQMTQSNLLKQLESLEQEIKLNEEKARQYLKENKRQMAKTYLRKKQLLEKNHEKRSVALHNIETLLCSVDEAQSNGEILDAYKIGSRALQSALNESGLKYDNVDELLSEVRDTIETHKEVQDAIANTSIAADVNATYDNDELERELQEIMGQTAKPAAAAVTVAAPSKQKQLTDNSHSVTRRAEITTHVVEISDAELLAMLEGLEVEDDSPTKSITSVGVNHANAN